MSPVHTDGLPPSPLFPFLHAGTCVLEDVPERLGNLSGDASMSQRLGKGGLPAHQLAPPAKGPWSDPPHRAGCPEMVNGVERLVIQYHWGGGGS